MTLAQALAALLGGTGLFLLGMWLMTDGLKLAAGNALRRVLAHGTQTPARALAAGAGLTATVQSSTAVTVATVGFVNAGLLTLAQAVWVVYGANVGTTMTGWIVAVTGVEIKLDRYALPLIGIGMLMRLSWPGTRRAAYGQALAGFAVFMLGILSLKESFGELGAHVDFTALPQEGWQATAIYFGIGLVLTALIHSSSATSAIAISAAAAGVLPVPLAALIIIGADLGTSSTAAFSAFGATANARRTAASHVMFNLVTTVFAVTALPWLLQLTVFLRGLFMLPDSPGITLALFSTTFNIIGVVLMLPITAPMVRFLEGRFVSQEEDLARPRHLDDTALEVPALALSGLVLEVQRLAGIVLQLAQDACEISAEQWEGLRRRAIAADQLAERIRTHVGRMNRSNLPPEVGDALAPLLRALQHCEEVTDLAVGATLPEPLEWFELSHLHEQSVAASRKALAAADTASASFDAAQLDARAAEADHVYENLKAALLRSAAEGRISVEAMDRRMQEIGRVHRAVERAQKAAQRIAPYRPTPAKPNA